MTENKRFSFSYSYIDGVKYLKDNGKIMPDNIALAVLNKLNDENEQLEKQLNRLYNYFEDWYRDMTSSNDFSEIWDNVKDDERWD